MAGQPPVPVPQGPADVCTGRTIHCRLRGSDHGRGTGREIPILGPFSLYARSGSPLNRYVFHLHSGLEDQARALAVFAAERLVERRPTAAILFSESEESSRELAEEMRTEFRRLGWGAVELHPVSRGAAARETGDHLRTENVEVVLILSQQSREIYDLFRCLVARLASPGAVARGACRQRVSEVALRRGDRLFLSFPTLPTDITREGLAEYERLAAAHGLPEEQRSSQIAALAAAKIFVDAMTSVGRNASREKLIEQLEHFYQKPTGLTRPITFDPNRRFGTRGAYILGLDPTQTNLVPVGGFIELPMDSP